MADTWMGVPFSVAPWPADAANSSSRTGSKTTPAARAPRGFRGDRHREERIVVREVGGAVERIDEPAHRRALVGARFLGEHGVIREAPPDLGEQEGLGAAVVLGDEIDAALALGSMESTVALEQDRAGGARHLDRGVAQGSGIHADQREARAALCGQRVEPYGQLRQVL